MPSATDLIERFLEDSGVQFRRAGDGEWFIAIQGERRPAFGVSFVVTCEFLEIESFFMRRPFEDRERFYELLLRRNTRAYGVHFALDVSGDVYLMGRRPLVGLDEDELDRLLGAVLVESDGMFEAAMSIGFASYLETERRWRATSASAGPADAAGPADGAGPAASVDPADPQRTPS